LWSKEILKTIDYLRRDMKTKLIIIRHGESEYNTKGICQGQVDAKLTNLGKRQAESLAYRLQNIKMDIIYSSPLQRAKVTAEIIKKDRDISIQIDEGLKEISCGYWEGIKVEKLKEIDPVELDNWETRPHEFNVRGGETFQQVYDRSSKALDSIIKDNEGKTIVIVAHLVSILLMLVHLKNEEIRNVWNIGKQPNTALNILELDRKGNVEFIINGDIGHLEPEDVAIPDWEPREMQHTRSIS
jgi:broad specificity phosphatase PhoE